jgi:D-alanyl-D-alanine carboxypeptidase
MPGLREAFDRIGAALERHLTVTHAAGAVLAVTDREEILGVAVRGMADAAAGTPVRPETRFQIGSISKSFAAIVALQEAEAGRLDLHVSVNELLPWLELPEPFGPITLHHLLTHTSGLAIGEDEAPTLLGALHLARGVPPTFPPGAHYWYSNDGYKIVGACLERVTGMAMPELLRDRIFGPAGMTSAEGAITDDVRTDLATGYEPLYSDRPPQLGHPLVPAPWIVSNTADGSIVSDVIDMSAYARLLLAGGDVPDGRGGRVLSESMFERMTAPLVDDGDGDSYGYGVWTEEVDGCRWIAHSGGMVGYTAYLAVSPDEGLGCVILQNGDGSMRMVLAHALAVVRASLAGDAPPDPWEPPAPTSIPAAAEFAGRYEGDDGRVIELVEEDDGLLLRVGPVSVRLERDPLSDPTDMLLVPHPALDRSALWFGRNPDGRVVEAFHARTWFVREGTETEPPGPVPEAWRAHPGTYRSDNPWSRVLRVLLRKGRLELEFPCVPGDRLSDGVLTPLDDGSFSVGEPWTPRRLRFEGNADGRSEVAVFNGVRWYRADQSEGTADASTAAPATMPPT